MLGPADLDAFPIFEDLCPLDNGEHPQFPQPEYLHKTFALELIESVLLTNYHHQFFRKVCIILTHPKPSNFSYSQRSRSYSYYNTASFPCSSKHVPSVPLTHLHSEAHMLSFSCSSKSPPSSRRRPSSSPQYSPNSPMAKLRLVSLDLGRCGSFKRPDLVSSRPTLLGVSV